MCLRINVTNPSNKDLKETGFKVSQTKEGSQALCRYMPDRQTNRQTDRQMLPPVVLGTVFYHRSYNQTVRGGGAFEP